MCSSSYKYSIGVYAFYFGKFPDWIDLYFECLRRNASIDFHIFTNCNYEKMLPSNVYLHDVDYVQYVDYISSKLGVKVSAENPIKLCDLRPMVGVFHRDVFKTYDFYGWIDLDLFLGDVRLFYTDEILSKYDVLSTHEIRIAGHFSLFRNTAKNRNKYKAIYRWKEAITNPSFVGIDEHGITNAYLMTVFDKFNEKFHCKIDNVVTRFFSRLKRLRLYMKEQYTTPFTPIPWLDGSLNNEQPSEWYYKNGVITNNKDGSCSFIYLHFMNFKSSTWRLDKNAPWQNKNVICTAKIEDMTTGVVINNFGISKL